MAPTFRLFSARQNTHASTLPHSSGAFPYESTTRDSCNSYHSLSFWQPQPYLCLPSYTWTLLRKFRDPPWFRTQICISQGKDWAGPYDSQHRYDRGDLTRRPLPPQALSTYEVSPLPFSSASLLLLTFFSFQPPFTFVKISLFLGLLVCQKSSFLILRFLWQALLLPSPNLTPHFYSLISHFLSAS